MKKLGLKDSALKCWNAGRRIRKNGHSGKMFNRFANGYGMAKQNTEELDDWKAFYSVHLERYLLSKRSRRIGTDAERDMIRDLIADHWERLKESGTLTGKTCEEKMALFRREKIVFPFFMVPNSLGDAIVPVHFNEKRKMRCADRCQCGSGLPFYMCCGRTPGVDELLNGLF